MKPNIDCLFIGHNEMDFNEYVLVTRNMGEESGAFRDLNLNFLEYNQRAFSGSDMFNLINKNLDYPYEPLKIGDTFSPAIAYLGSYLHRHGLVFDYVNAFQESKEELAAKLREKHIMTVAVVTTLYVSVIPILEILEFIKSHNPEVKIILGGPFVSTQARTLEPRDLEYMFTKTIPADYFIRESQGEGTLVKLLKALKHDHSLHDVENLYYKDGDRLVSTSFIKESNHLDDNPIDWRLFPSIPLHDVNLRTSVSCPFSCAFCGFPEHAGQYHTASVETVEQELNRLQERGTRNIYFIDDTFNVPPHRFKELLKMIIRNHYSFNWHAYYRCQFADRETVELMKESGCDGVFLGIESGSDAILKNMNKGSRVDQYMEGIRWLKEYDIVTFGSFITGFPGETEDTAEETAAFIRDSGLDFYRTQMWYCEPITPIWQEREKYRIKGESFAWSHATMNSKTAADLIDQLVLSIDSAIWIPQHHFDFDKLWHLVHRGMSREQVKAFVSGFSQGIKQKLSPTYRGEVDFDLMNQLENALKGQDTDPSGSAGPDLNNRYDADFDF